MRALAIILISFLMLGCTRTVYVPKEIRIIEYRDRVERDSVYVRDSVWLREKGDTVYLYRYKYIFKDRYLRDTVVRLDSVSYPVYVDVVREVRHVPGFYKVCFWIALVAVGGWVFSKRKWILKLLKL